MRRHVRPYLPAGCIAHWRFEGHASARRGTVVDRTGNGHNLTSYGRPAMESNGTTDCLYRQADLADVIAGHRYGVWAMRFYAGIATGTTEFVARCRCGVGSYRPCFDVVIDGTGGNLRFSLNTDGEGNVRTAASDVIPSRSAWHSLIVVADATDNTVTVFLNGAAGQTVALDDALDQTTFAASAYNRRLYLMAGDATGESGLAGRMTCALFGGTNAPVTDDDSRAFHRNPEGWIVAAGFGSYWLIDERTGATAVDGSGNGNHLTISGATWNVGANGGGLYRHPSAVRVLGTLTPDATGLYLPAGTHNGAIYYQREDEAYVYYATALGYKLSAELDASTGARWSAAGTDPTYLALAPYDATGTAYAGLWGDAWTAAGRWFDGANDCAARADASNFALGTGEFTAAIHVAPEAYNSYPQLIGAGGSGATEWRLANVYSSYNVLTFSAGGQSVQTDLVDDGEPHVIVARRTSTRMSIWIDGEEAVDEPRTPGNITTTAPLRLMAGGAASMPDAARFARGQLFSAEVFRWALSDRDIVATATRRL